MKSLLFSTKVCCGLVVMASAAIISCNNDSSSKATEDSTTKMSTDTMSKMVTNTTPMPIVDHAEAYISATFPDTAISGTLKFNTEPDGKVKMVLDLSIPAKAGKSVAVHIHQDGDCGDMGNMAHGHWNPTNAKHGKWGSASFHSGDIGNVKLDAKGKGTLTITTDLWTLGGTSDKNILGKSIIVHGGEDDYTSQPAGNSGPRIGCGVIR